MPEFTVTATYTVEADSHQEARENCLQGTLESTEARLNFEDVTATHDGVVVRFHYLDEGYEGTFDQDDEDDEPLLRMDVNEAGRSNGEGPDSHDQSGVTHINALKVDCSKLKAYALHMAKQFHALGPASWKTLAAELSRTTADKVNDFTTGP